MTEAAATIGILGGMGPLASAEFYGRLIELTPAADDQSHFPVVLWSEPSTPDRSAAILGDGVDPTPWLRDGLQALERLGATLIAVPCNTAHHFLPAASDGITVRVLDMVQETCDRLARQRPRVRRVGLLGTPGLLTSGLYQRRLKAAGIDCVTPGETQYGRVLEAITAVKAGDDLIHAGSILAECAVALGGCDAILAACTEIPPALSRVEHGLPIVDPGLILARRTIDLATEQRGRTGR
ncbi:amino acid racemase [Kribbella sp. NBC_00709]|uniref:aspartate/glutamate racemase family protein n=1 Tax=Kribbella sp. NBC_00709 TaxID=2975972 RepID=UPI002E2D1204|nr:amino acid racemase [Kribbella sp. NBC_00709]